MKDIKNYLVNESSMLEKDPAFLAAKAFNDYIYEYDQDEIDSFVEIFMDKITDNKQDELILRAFRTYLK